MESVPINWWAVIVAAAVKFGLGALWFSPALFIKPWMAATGTTEESMRSGFAAALISDAIGALILSFVLFHAVRYAGATNVLAGGAVGLLCWLAFIATFSIGSVFYEKRPWSLWLIGNGYWAVALVVMGAIFGIWR